MKCLSCGSGVVSASVATVARMAAAAKGYCLALEAETALALRYAVFTIKH